MAADIRAEALGLLRQVLAWQLAADRWHAVDRVLRDLAAALAADEPLAIREVLGDLDMAGPTRAVRIEDAERLPPPQPVRERINQLVHTLETGESSAGGESTGQEPG